MAEKASYYPLPKTTQELYGSFHHSHIDPSTFVILAGRGNEPLAEAVGELLDVDVDFPCTDFPNGETRVKIGPNLRGKEVFVINSLQPNPNRGLQETIFMGDAIKRADAKPGKVTAMLPKIAYDRQDRKPESRTPISIAAVAAQLKFAAEYNRLFTIDLHADQSVGSFPNAWDNVYGSKVLLPAIEALELDEPVLLAPDAGSTKRARVYAEKLGSNDVAFVDKRRDKDDPYKTESFKIVGDVRGRDVLIVDDVVGSGGTLVNAANIARENGAQRIVAAATHAEFTPDKDGLTLPQKLNQPDHPLNRILITDTIFQAEDIRGNERIDIVTVAPVLAVAILCYLTDNSISQRLIK
jgi:ribose-phosphate pyrophosphokinase